MSAYDLVSRLEEDPTVTFGVRRPVGSGGEVVGPMATNGVQVGEYVAVASFSVFPMLHLHFNKYNSNLPPWERTVEGVLTDGTHACLVKFHEYLGQEITGNLKSIQMALSSALAGVDGGDIISREDVLHEPHRRSQDEGGYK